jgi:putative IMPACT (imprinted ancient) family translation regulator
MAKQSVQFYFGDGIEPTEKFYLYERIITDRGSRYSVSVGLVQNREDIKKFLKLLKSRKKYARATHNTWAARIAREGAVYETKQDDGETGAGMVILRVMQQRNLTNAVVCVTRWFRGVKLQGDRFKHVKDATQYAVDQIEKN